jgi:hypothetical protein
MRNLERPPIDRIGALEVDDFLTKRERRELGAALNTLLASPTFASLQRWQVHGSKSQTVQVGSSQAMASHRSCGDIASVAAATLAPAQRRFTGLQPHGIMTTAARHAACSRVARARRSCSRPRSPARGPLSARRHYQLRTP